MSKEIKKPAILVCGSSDLTDKNFVFTMLSLVNSKLQLGGSQIGVIHTSGFAGASKFAKLWVELENERNISNKTYQRIELKEHTFDMQLESRNHSFYEDASLPIPVLRNDPFYKKGQEQILKTGIHFVMAFPNNTGKMGPSTANILRFAEMANIHKIDCAAAYRLLQDCQKKVEREHQINSASSDEENIRISQPTLVNRRALVR